MAKRKCLRKVVIRTNGKYNHNFLDCAIYFDNFFKSLASLIENNSAPFLLR